MGSLSLPSSTRSKKYNISELPFQERNNCTSEFPC